MQWIETIQFRPYSQTDKMLAIQAFEELPQPERNLCEIDMLQSINVENELTILLFWENENFSGGKSDLGYQLAAAFSRYGHVYHSGWISINRTKYMEEEEKF